MQQYWYSDLEASHLVVWHELTSEILSHIGSCFMYVHPCSLPKSNPERGCQVTDSIPEWSGGKNVWLPGWLDLWPYWTPAAKRSSLFFVTQYPSWKLQSEGVTRVKLDAPKRLFCCLLPPIQIKTPPLLHSQASGSKWQERFGCWEVQRSHYNPPKEKKMWHNWEAWHLPVSQGQLLEACWLQVPGHWQTYADLKQFRLSNQ